MQMSRAARWRGSATRGRGAAARLVVIGLIAVGATLTATATAQSMAGTYQGQIDAGPVRVQLVVTGTALAGTLNGPGIAFQLEGEAIGTEAYGLVHTAHGTAEFEAYLDGDTLGLYLFEVDAAGQPIMSTVIELILTRTPTTQQQAPGAAAGLDKWPQDGTSSTQAADPPLASGAYAVLSLDDAVAFIEALEFVLDQIGYAYAFNDSERQELVRALASNFPAADRMDQLVLADARTIWEHVKVNWPVAAEADKREFALGVLILAFGEETVAAWAGPSGGGGTALGGGSCATFEDCTGAFVDESTWSDTFNAQGCWAAAGCGGFDPATNSFDYGD